MSSSLTDVTAGQAAKILRLPNQHFITAYIHIDLLNIKNSFVTGISPYFPDYYTLPSPEEGSPGYPQPGQNVIGIAPLQGVSFLPGSNSDVPYIKPTELTTNSIHFELYRFDYVFPPPDPGGCLNYEWRAVFDLELIPVPEPGTYLLLGSSLFCIAIAKRKRLKT